MDTSPEHEDWRRERSLLELGRAMRGEGHFDSGRRSLVMTAESHDVVEEPFDARERHRLARARREAIENTTHPDSLTETKWPQDDEDRQADPVPVDAEDGESWSGPAASASRSPRRRLSRRIVAATTALGLLMGAAVAYSLPSRYQATADLTLGADKLSGGALESQLRVLTSGIVLTRVVDGLNLANDPEFNGRDGGAGKITGLLRALLMRDGGGADEGHRHAFAVDRLSAVLSVSRGPGDGGIAVTATTGNGEKSALIANAVAGAFVEVYEQNRSGAVTGSVSDSRTEPDTAAAAAHEHLADFAKANDRPDLVKDTSRIAEILDLDKDLKEARAHTAALNARVSALRSADVDSLGGGLPGEFETGAVQALRMQYLDIKRQADQAASKLGSRNPERRAIEAQLEGARGRLADELRRIVASQQSRLKQAVETEQALASRLARTGLSVQDIAALRDIQRELASTEIDRKTLTGSISATGSGAVGQGAGIVSRAMPPTQPSGPPRLMMTLSGAALGLFAGLGLGAIRGRDESPRVPADDDMLILYGTEPDLTKRRRDPWRTARHDEPDEPVLPHRQNEASAHRFEAQPDAWSPDHPLPYPPALMDPMETNMNPVYPDHLYAQAPQQPQSQPGSQARQWQLPAYPPAAPYQPAPYAAQAYPHPAYPPHPVMQHMPGYPMQAWPVAAGAAPAYPYYPYPVQAHPYAGAPHLPQQDQPAPDQWQRSAIDHDALDEIRASLHEFRQALRDLAESRPRRRIL